ncbi:uncharacterized protein VTP21DRAFT_5486 [Calcarisporiella thermophila]|uniref:uncharacterized protein n=1 Tax=Calcarisporiella thermophila TaxID=911321 RepID=UPI0037423CB9
MTTPNGTLASSEQAESNSESVTIDVISENIAVEDLYDKEKFNLENMETEQIFQLLKTSNKGLTSEDAKLRIEKFGRNELKQKETNPIFQFLSFMWNPLSWVMEAAAVVAIALSNGEGKPPDWEDFVGIILLLIGNSIIGFIEERRAGSAVKALMDSLAPQAKVKRDGGWKTMEAAELVPGDIISVKLGDVVPADARLIKAVNVSIDQAALTGESLPVSKEIDDEIFSGSTVKQGEAEAVVIGTGIHTFFGRAAELVQDANDGMGHLQQVLAKIGTFCIVSIAIFLVTEILVMYAGFHYEYRRGINNLLVLLIGGIPIAMPTVLSVTLAIGAKQLAEDKAIVTRISAIEELAGVTILCSDKTGTLTLNELTVNHELIKQYSDYSVDDILRMAAYASRIENQDAIDACIVRSLSDPTLAHEGIDVLDFKPFNPVDKRTEVTYRNMKDNTIHRVSKGMSRVIFDLCSRDKTEELEMRLTADVDEFAVRGLRSLAVAEEDVPDGGTTDQGNGFRLIGLLPLHDPPRHDTKETIDRALSLGVHVKMITGDQLAIAKETGRNLGMGTNMYNSKLLNNTEMLPPEHKSIDELVLAADGFAGVYPEHKYEIVERLQKMGHMVAMTGDGVNDAPALAKANVGVAVADSSDAARSAADIVLTEPGLSVIIKAFNGSRQIFQRMRNYSIYTCSVTIRVVVSFAVLLFAFRFDFPPFMVLILAILNDGTILTISKDRVKPSKEPNNWNLFEIFTYAIVYGLYLSLSSVIFFYVATQTSFFTDRWGLVPFTDANDFRLHSVMYLQVSTISQALIFVTRSQGFSWNFYSEPPSILLCMAFLVAQLVATFISVYANWGFTQLEGCGWGWAGAAWIWNICWFFPLDLLKFATAFVFSFVHDRYYLSKIPEVSLSSSAQLQRPAPSTQSSYYAPRLQPYERPRRNFAKLFAAAGKLITKTGKRLSMPPAELQRFQSVQTQHVSRVLSGQSH